MDRPAVERVGVDEEAGAQVVAGERGDDLARELGIDPGPELGRLLAEIAEAQYAGEVSSREEAVEYARGAVRQPR